MQVEEDQAGPVLGRMFKLAGKLSLCIPDIPHDMAWKMMHGTARHDVSRV
jgi:hypothetical protein